MRSAVAKALGTAYPEADPPEESWLERFAVDNAGRLGWRIGRALARPDDIARLVLQQRETELEMRRIPSPIDGVVVDRFKGPGEYVQETEILALAQIDPLHVEVVVPVAHFGAIQRGMRARVRPEAPVEQVFEAKVTVVDKVVDAASSTFGVRLEIPNPSLEIPSGLRCTVEFDH